MAREDAVNPAGNEALGAAGPGAAGATADLVARARAGDRDAYDRLFELAADRALLFVRLRLGPALRDKVDALDVLQEAYLEAHQAFPRFEYRGRASFSRWLCRSIVNRIRGLADHFGAKKRQARPAGGAPPPPISHVLERAAAPDTGPVTAVARQEERERLARAIEQLEPDEREVLLLRYFQDRTIEEVAASLGRSESAARRPLGRATARLGRIVGPASA